jgi:hypothetical protein
MAEESNPEISQNESELDTHSKTDTSFEVEAEPESVIKEEPEPEVADNVEDSKQASVSDISSPDIKPEIKDPVVREEKQEQVILPSSC